MLFEIICRMRQVRIIPLVFILLVPGFSIAGTQEAADNINRYFGNLEKVISACASRPEMLARKVSLADVPVQKLLKDNSEIYSVIRINQRGIVVNEAVREGKPGRKLRDLSDQKWFRTLTHGQQHFGSVTTTNGKQYLFWCIPVKNENSTRDAFLGALVVRIDLREALYSAADYVKIPFCILHDKVRVFSHEWKSSNPGPSLPVDIKGLDNVEIEISADQISAPVSSSKSDIPPVSEGKTSGGQNLALIIVLAAVAAGMFGLAIAGYFHVLSRKRHSKLMEKLDKENQPFEYGETVVMDRSRIMPAPGRGGAVSSDQHKIRDRIKETRIMSIEQMRSDVEGEISRKLDSVMAERTNQIRSDAYAEVRLAFLTNMKSFSLAIGTEVEKLAQFIAAGKARGPQESQDLQIITGELQRIRDAIEGRQ